MTKTNFNYALQRVGDGVIPIETGCKFYHFRAGDPKTVRPFVIAALMHKV